MKVNEDLSILFWLNAKSPQKKVQEVATICGIKKELTTHEAHIATTVLLENDVSIETVGKLLGHKDLRSTQIYAKITKRKISNNMKALENKIFCEQGLLKV